MSSILRASVSAFKNKKIQSEILSRARNPLKNEISSIKTNMSKVDSQVNSILSPVLRESSQKVVSESPITLTGSSKIDSQLLDGIRTLKKVRILTNTKRAADFATKKGLEISGKFLSSGIENGAVLGQKVLSQGFLQGQNLLKKGATAGKKVLVSTAKAELLVAMETNKGFSFILYLST